MNHELEIEKILEVDSDFIESLCKQLEFDGIHLTNELLVKILTTYEQQKYDLLKTFIEELVGQEGITLNDGTGPSVIQVVVEKARNKDDDEQNDLFSKIDSKYLN